MTASRQSTDACTDDRRIALTATLKAILETGVTARTIKLAAFAGIVLVVSSAQMSLPPTIDLPITMPWVDDQGVRQGTATRSGNRTYMRNLKGELIMTVVSDANGVSMYDHSGNLIRRVDRTPANP